jgi:hypothetical protein
MEDGEKSFILDPIHTTGELVCLEAKLPQLFSILTATINSVKSKKFS